MKSRVSLDRFEGPDREIAVLVTEDGRQFDVPRDLLPRTAEGGDLLTLTLERDLKATRRLIEDTRSVQEELRKRDPGGDVKL